MSTTNSAYDAAIAADPAARDAADFHRTFEPKADVDYGWVADYAKDRYAEALKVFDDLDAKATAIVNYLASGAGLFTLGTLAGVATAKVPAAVVVCALPSMTCAVAAIILATLARRPADVFPPASIRSAIDLAEHYKHGEYSKAAFAPHWALLVALLRPTLAAKAWNVDWATRAMAAAVSLLLLPLVVSLCLGPR